MTVTAGILTLTAVARNHSRRHQTMRRAPFRRDGRITTRRAVTYFPHCPRSGTLVRPLNGQCLRMNCSRAGRTPPEHSGAVKKKLNEKPRSIKIFLVNFPPLSPPRVLKPTLTIRPHDVHHRLTTSSAKSTAFARPWRKGHPVTLISTRLLSMQTSTSL